MIVCNICTLKQSINNSECEACGLPLISAPPQPLNPIRSNSSPPPLDLGTPSRGTPSYRELLTNTNLSHSRPVSNEELEEMKRQVALKMGYELVDHRLELFGKKIKN